MAKRTNTYVGKTYNKDMKVKIPLRDAVARTRCKHWVDIRLASTSNTNPYFRIYYEDYLADENLVMDQVLKFLGREIVPSAGEHKVTRQSVSPVPDQVINYDELKSELLRHDLLDGRKVLE